MVNRRRKRWPFDDDFFGDFDEFFEEMREKMQRIMESALKQTESGKPFVYGYSFRVGPDGKPEFREFGDTSILRPGLRGDVGREPLTDVIDREDSVSITVEVPGVNREDVDLRVTERRVTISVDTAERKYYKEVDLPGAVDPDSIKATFKNGVLDVTMKKTGKPKGKKVGIN